MDKYNIFVLGIAVVAIPSGIITAGYMKEVNEYHD